MCVASLASTLIYLKKLFLNTRNYLLKEINSSNSSNFCSKCEISIFPAQTQNPLVHFQAVFVGSECLLFILRMSTDVAGLLSAPLKVRSIKCKRGNDKTFITGREEVICIIYAVFSTIISDIHDRFFSSSALF